MENQPTQHTPASIARNIGIGVVTPVLAATIIYFLGFNKGDTTGFKKKKEATIKAWTTYVQNKSIFSKVFQQMDHTDTSAGLDGMRSNVNHEIDVTVQNMDDIKKETDADPRVFSTIDITVLQINEIKPIINKFIDDVGAFSLKDTSEEAFREFAMAQQDELVKKMRMLRQRDSIRLSVFYDGLNKDYDVVLPKN